MSNHKNSNSFDSLSLIFKETRKYPVLSREAEYKLAVRAARGEKKAKDLMILHNMLFVISVAVKYTGSLPLPDAFSYGILGLGRAVEKFDPKKGFKFVTYAKPWVRQHIQRALMNWEGDMIRKPSYFYENQNKIRKAQYLFNRKYGCMPTSTEIAEWTKLKVEKVKETFALSGKTLHLESTIGNFGNEDNSTTLLKILSVNEKSPTDIAIQKEEFQKFISRVEQLVDAVMNLKILERNKKIFIFHYGIDDFSFKYQTLENTSKKFSITRERVRQILVLMWKKLKFKVKDVKSLQLALKIITRPRSQISAYLTKANKRITNSRS